MDQEMKNKINEQLKLKQDRLFCCHSQENVCSDCLKLITGNVVGIRGDVSGITGDVSEIIKILQKEE